MPLEYIDMIWAISIITIASIVLLPLLAWILTWNDSHLHL